MTTIKYLRFCTNYTISKSSVSLPANIQSCHLTYYQESLSHDNAQRFTVVPEQIRLISKAIQGSNPFWGCHFEQRSTTLDHGFVLLRKHWSRVTCSWAPIFQRTLKHHDRDNSSRTTLYTNTSEFYSIVFDRHPHHHAHIVAILLYKNRYSCYCWHFWRYWIRHPLSRVVAWRVIQCTKPVRTASSATVHYFRL